MKSIKFEKEHINKIIEMTKKVVKDYTINIFDKEIILYKIPCSYRYSLFEYIINILPELIFSDNKHKQFVVKYRMIEGLTPYKSAKIGNQKWYYQKQKHPVDVLYYSFNKKFKKNGKN